MSDSPDKYDNMKLPLSGDGDDLETISENRFKPLFDVKKFQIRSEDERDKGIDHTIEIKSTGRNFNFRFAVQLKATESKEKNKDGSISLDIKSSNINYLLNNSGPAYYVLYSLKDEEFYYESINDFVRSLKEKNKSIDEQDTHALRFSKKLNDAAIELMYKETLEKGKLHRELNEKLIAAPSIEGKSDTIQVDQNLKVSSDSDIRKMIEALGFELINQSRWKEVLAVHKKASGNVATTARYNLIIGMCYYYSSKMIDALSYLKSSLRLKDELEEELQAYVVYFDATIRYYIGIISKEEYQSILDSLDGSDAISLYVRLDRATVGYSNTMDVNVDVSYNRFKIEIENIINNPKASNKIKIQARCELLIHEGIKNNIDLVRNIAKINYIESITGPNYERRMALAQELINSHNAWYKRTKELIDEATELEDWIHVGRAILGEVKVKYEFKVHCDVLTLKQDDPNQPTIDFSDSDNYLQDLLDKLENVTKYYNDIGSIESGLSVLYTKYEILHYKREYENANQVMKEMEDTIDEFDLVKHKEKLDILKDGGTTHEMFEKFIDEKLNHSSLQEKFDKQRDEMISMDEEESKIEKPSIDAYTIHLFPIGYFDFPKDKKSVVYGILNVQEGVRDVFDNMLGSVCPIANIYNNPITSEGALEGILEYKGSFSQENIYRIRKAFYEHKFYRNESIKFG